MDIDVLYVKEKRPNQSFRSVLENAFLLKMMKEFPHVTNGAPGRQTFLEAAVFRAESKLVERASRIRYSFDGSV